MARGMTDESPEPEELLSNTANNMTIDTSDIPPGWELRVSNLSIKFPKLQQATLVAALTHSDGHVGQAINKLKQCKSDDQGAFVAKLEAGWPEAAPAPANKGQELEPSGGKKHMPRRKLGKDQTLVTVVGGQDPGMTFADHRARSEVKIDSVKRGGPAAKKGIGTHCFHVAEVAGVRVMTCAELKAAVDSVKPGEKFDFVVGRRFKTKETRSSESSSDSEDDAHVAAARAASASDQDAFLARLAAAEVRGAERRQEPPRGVFARVFGRREGGSGGCNHVWEQGSRGHAGPCMVCKHCSAWHMGGEISFG